MSCHILEPILLNFLNLKPSPLGKTQIQIEIKPQAEINHKSKLIGPSFLAGFRYNCVEQLRISAFDMDGGVDLSKLEDFASHYQIFLTQAIPPNDLRQMIKKFIHKVEAGTETVKIHWIVDEEHLERELALKRASSSPSGAVLNFKSNLGSHRLTNGARGGT